MTEEVITIGEGIGRTMAHRLIFLLIAFEQQGATAIAHVSACLIQIRTSHLLAPAYGNTIVALDATAAVIPAHEEIVITTMLHDERSLDGIGAGKLGSRIRLCSSIAHGMTAGDGQRLSALLDMHRLLIQLNHLDTIPERAPGKPRGSLLINNEIRIDGIPVVSITLGDDEAALILPSILIR